MSITDFKSIVYLLVLGIVILAVLGSLSKNRFRRTVYKDEFRSKKQVGKSNIGKIKQEKTYREIVKERNLEEAKNLDHRINPKVTGSIAKVSKDVRNRELE